MASITRLDCWFNPHAKAAEWRQRTPLYPHNSFLKIFFLKKMFVAFIIKKTGEKIVAWKKRTREAVYIYI